MRTLLALATAATITAAATAVDAQQTSPAALESGRRAIEISLPDGGGSDIGLWWVRSPATQLALVAHVRVASEELPPGANDRRTVWSVEFGPAIKRHVAVTGPIVPWWRADARLGLRGGSSDVTRATTVLVSGGFGADWFPVDRVGIGGHMGLRAFHTRLTDETAGGDVTRDGTEIATFRSGLSMKLYF